MNHLLPCTGCARHVRAGDPICPFCGEILPLSLRQSASHPHPARRLGRAATFAFGAALAATTGVGCEDGATPPDSGGGEDSGAAADSGGADAGPIRSIIVGIGGAVDRA